MNSPIRVWLEPDYDFGRFGAWMLDMPGCFVWADDREAALARVPVRAAEFAGWLGRHGEAPDVPAAGLPAAGLPSAGLPAADVPAARLPAARLPAADVPVPDRIEVVEEVKAIAKPQTEINAFFDADRRPATPEDIERAIRWLDFARRDLVELLDRTGQWPSAGSDLAVRGPDRTVERTVGSVARHLAGAEIWLTTRFDPTRRYGGPGADADLRAYLGSTRAWAVDQLHELQTTDAATERTDSRGEAWTLSKLLRRLVYHSLDHLGEAEQLLAEQPSASRTSA